MKLNFWQWLGVALLIIGAIIYVYERQNKPAPVVDPGPARTTPPTTLP